MTNKVAQYLHHIILTHRPVPLNAPLPVETLWAWASGNPISLYSAYYPTSYQACKLTPGANGCCTPGVDCLFEKDQPRLGKLHFNLYLNMAILSCD